MLNVDRIRVITFDLDDTLWEVRPAMLAAEQAQRAFLAAHAPRLAARVDADGFARLRAGLIGADPGIVHSVTRLRLALLEAALRAADYAPSDARSLAAEAFAVFLDTRQRVTPYEGVEALLAALGARYRLGALSNGNADVRRLPIGRHFAFTVSADEIGRSKPDPAIFAAAERLAGAPAHAILHVGDHPEHDVAGAGRAGFATAWVQRDGRVIGDTEPDLTVASVLELRALLLAGSA